MFAKFTGQLIEVGAGGVLALTQDMLERLEVGFVLGEFFRGLFGDALELFGNGGVVDIAFARAGVGDEFRFFQLSELGGNAGLAHREDFLQFGHRELFAESKSKRRRRVGSAESLRKLRIDGIGKGR